MKRFNDYINEAKKKDEEEDCPTVPPMREILSNSSPFIMRNLMRGRESIVYGFDVYSPESKKCIKKNAKNIDHNRDCISAVNSWFDTMKEGKADIMGEIIEMGNYPNKASWACWQGTGYRGLVKNKRFAEKINLTGDIVVKPGQQGKDEFYAVGYETYKSKYAAQSWSSEWKIAFKFCSLDADTDKLSVIVEMPLNKKETLFSPEFTNMVSNYSESEVIRTSNKPTKCKMYLRLHEIHYGLNWKIVYPFKLEKASEKEKEKYYVQEWSKKLAVLLGDKNAKKLLNNPKYMSIVKRKRRTDY